MEVGDLLKLKRVPLVPAGPPNIPSSPLPAKIKSYRSIWISDLHIGTRRFQAEALLDFLNRHIAENLFLVGDIIDGWNHGPTWYSSAAQDAVVAELRRWVREGTRVELIPGNHDVNPELAEKLLGLRTGEPELLYRTGEGRKMLVIHGHQFDRAMAGGRWWPGGQTYAVAMRINEWYRRDPDIAGPQERILSKFFRYRLRRAVQYFTDFDDRAIVEAVHQRKADGIICGHIHRAEQRLLGPVWYINDGDWVESRTALVEGWDGTLRLLRWDPFASSAAAAMPVEAAS